MNQSVNTTYRHIVHAMPPYGWCNDPNGLCFFQGRYHLFFQHNPNDSKWGPMHWGHLASKDCIHWDNLPIALTPGENCPYEGAFSGSAIEWDGRLHLFYTGHQNSFNDKPARQVQCHAISEDGVHFQTVDHSAVDERQLPPDADTVDFRDPKVWNTGHGFAMAVGTRAKDCGGRLLFFKSPDMEKWIFASELVIPDIVSATWECPDIFELGGYEVLLMSPTSMRDRLGEIGNVHKSVAILGNLNPETLDFAPKTTHVLDYGFDFYAPQTMLSPDGRRIMIAWMNMWERTQIPHQLGHGWAGSMTIPRELNLHEGTLYQQPVRELQNYRKSIASGENIRLDQPYTVPLSAAADIELTLSRGSTHQAEVSLYGKEVLLELDFAKGQIRLTRRSRSNPIESFGKPDDIMRSVWYNFSESVIPLRIIVDVSSVEFFIDDGRITMTCLIFSENENNLCVSSDKNAVISRISCWEIAG